MMHTPNIFITQSRKDTKKKILQFLYLCALAALRDTILRPELRQISV